MGLDQTHHGAEHPNSDLEIYIFFKAKKLRNRSSGVVSQSV